MRLDWENFSAIHGKNANDEFEVIAGMLIEHVETGKITNTPANYKGIESEPFKNQAGKSVAYQAKFFLNPTDTKQVGEFMDSLQKLSKDETNLIDILYLASNKLGSSTQIKIKTKLNAHFTSIGAKLPEIKFICGITRFKSDLLKERDLDNARAYFFGGGNPRSLHLANVEEKVKSLISEGKYIELEMRDTSSSYDSTQLLEKIIKTDRANFLLVAGAGTGKSLLLQKLTFDFGSLDKQSAEMMQAIIKQGIIIFLKASLYKGQSLSMVISNKLNSYGLNFTDYPITIILDGLDELNVDASTSMINELQDLYKSERIKKCIASVRLASSSATRYQQIMSPHLITIQPISEAKMIEYFEKKNNKEKTEYLKEIIKNKENVSDITDIRILELYWMNISKGLLPSKPQIFGASFASNVGDRTLSLNLLNPKKKSLGLILESLSIKTLLQGGRTIELSFLQKKILQLYPKLNYRDANEVVDLIANVCGEKGNFDEGEDFTFEHKSWIDYFSSLHLARKFKDDKDSLLELIDYEDVLSSWFIPVAKYEYRREGKLPEAIAVGVIESYLHFESDRKDEVGEQIIKIQLSVNDDALRESVILFAEELLSADSTTNPRIIYEYLQAGYKDIAKRLFVVFYNKLNSKNNEAVNNTYWEYLTYYYLLEIRFSKKSPQEILKTFNEMVEEFASRKNWDVDRKLKSMVPKIYKELLIMGVSLENIFTNMNKNILTHSFGFIYTPEVIREVMNSETIKKSLTNLINRAVIDDVDRFSLMALLGISFEDLENVKSAYQKLNNDIDVHFDEPGVSQTKLYLLGKTLGWTHGFEKKIEGEKFKYFSLKDVFDLIFSFATERDFQSDYTDFEQGLTSLLEKVDSYSSNRDNFIRRAITELIGFVAQKMTIQNTKSLLQLNKDQHIRFFTFPVLLELIFERDKVLFKKLFKLDEVEETLNSLRGDLQSYSDELRGKALLIANIDPSKAPDLINELRRLTRLRYGYHKDILGFFLTTALKIIWEKDYYSYDQKLTYTEKIYVCIMNIQDITDRDEVGWLPDWFFEILIANDFDLALNYYSKYAEDNYDMPIIEQFNIAKIKRGDNFEDIKQLMNSYRRQYRTQDEVFESYYESRFTLMVNVAMSELYSKENKIEAIKLASDELKQLKKQDKNYRESDYSYGKYLSEAISNYRRLKGLLVTNEALESFPRPKLYPPSNRGITAKRKLTKYDKEKFDAEKQFANLPSLRAYKKIIKDICSTKYSHYNSEIVNSKESVDHFVSALESNKEPFENFSHLVSVFLDEYSYRHESRYFVYKIWKSPLYKHLFVEFLFEKQHYYDTDQLLKVWAESGEKELVIGLIKQIVDCIVLLSRKN